MNVTDQMRTSSALARGSIVRTLNLGLGLFVTLIMAPIIIHSLGDRAYGLWIIIGTFFGYYNLLDLGLSSAVSRYLSRAVGQNNVSEITKVTATAFFLFAGIGIVALVLSIGVVVFADCFVEVSAEVHLFRLLVLLLGFGVAVGFPARAFEGVLTSYLRYDLSAYASAVRLLLVNAVMYLFLRNGYGILTVAIINVCGSLLEYAILFYFARRTFSGLSLSPAYFRAEMAGPFFSYSWKTLLATLADILRFRVDAIIIAAYLNLALVTYYSVGVKLVDYFASIITTVIGILMPVFSRYESDSDWDSIRATFLSSTKVATILSVFIGASMLFYGKPFMQRWMGSEFSSSYYVMVILCVPSIVALMQNPSIGLLYGISKHHYYAISNGCEGIFNLVLSLILVRYYGIYGVALGTAVEMLVFKLLIQPFFVCRVIGLPVHRYYLETLLLTTLKTLAPLLIYFYFVRNIVSATYSSIGSLGMAQIVLFLPIVYFLLLKTSEKRFVRRVIEYAIG